MKSTTKLPPAIFAAPTPTKKQMKYPVNLAAAAIIFLLQACAPPVGTVSPTPFPKGDVIQVTLSDTTTPAIEQARTAIVSAGYTVASTDKANNLITVASRTIGTSTIQLHITLSGTTILITADATIFSLHGSLPIHLHSGGALGSKYRQLWPHVEAVAAQLKGTKTYKRTI